MTEKPILIAGPCLAESYELLDEVLAFLSEKIGGLGDFYFKASFDKANRTSTKNSRGEGLDKTMGWFADLKTKYKCKLITDIHESTQVKEVALICDALQIPAFLCRQTDLLLAACEAAAGAGSGVDSAATSSGTSSRAASLPFAGSGLNVLPIGVPSPKSAASKLINIKKGQFMAPLAMAPILEKATAHCKGLGLPAPQLALTERGTSFGYGDLVVDYRAFPWMHSLNVPVLFDVTHSTQKPPVGLGANHSSGLRSMAPSLARAAAASGYLSGFFLEVHPNPNKAKSDASTQLSIKQADVLLDQLIPLWRQGRMLRGIDGIFVDS